MKRSDTGVWRCPVRPMHVLRTFRPILFCTLLLPAACMQSADAGGQPTGALPVMRWDHRPEAAQWTQATLDALRSEGAVLASTVPMDVAQYCPDYATAPVADRQAFWAGLFSAIAKYESTWNPRAKGGGGRYVGLLQISPATADQVGCDLGAGGLTDGASNLACAVRIAANRVPENGGTTENEALAAIVTDWGPMHDSRKRSEVAAWTRSQAYCSGSQG